MIEGLKCAVSWCLVTTLDSELELRISQTKAKYLKCYYHYLSWTTNTKKTLIGEKENIACHNHESSNLQPFGIPLGWPNRYHRITYHHHPSTFHPLDMSIAQHLKILCIHNPVKDKISLLIKKGKKKNSILLVMIGG